MATAALFTSTPPPCEPLALRPKDAAAALGISERLLYAWSHGRGLPVVRIDRTVLYPVAGLRKWLEANSEMQRSIAPLRSSSPHSVPLVD